MAPLRLASKLQSLPPILHMTVPSPIPGYSKAPRGLFVLPRVARVFTGTAISPSPPSRQWPSRSTIHAGRNLPDKGLRYLRQIVTPQFPVKKRLLTVKTDYRVGRSFLPASACRHADRTISSRSLRQRVWRMVSEDSRDAGLRIREAIRRLSLQSSCFQNLGHTLSGAFPHLRLVKTYWVCLHRPCPGLSC